MSRMLDRRTTMKLGAAAGLGVIPADAEPATGGMTRTEPHGPNLFLLRTKSHGPHMMPAHFEWSSDSGAEGIAPPQDPEYHDVTSIGVTYLTDRQRLQQFLPDPFRVGETPLLSVVYSMNRQIDWLAGGAYNIVGVYAPAVFHGARDHVTGAYCLVLWENLTDPILTGREIAGIPKIYGDIEDHTVINGIWRASASHRGHTILDVTASELNALDAPSCRAMEDDIARHPMMGWKYIPNETNTGAVISHATVFPYAIRVRQAWSAKGQIQWYGSSWAKNPTQSHIINALKSLPVLETQSTLVWKGSLTLYASKARKLQ